MVQRRLRQKGNTMSVFLLFPAAASAGFRFTTAFLWNAAGSSLFAIFSSQSISFSAFLQEENNFIFLLKKIGRNIISVQFFSIQR